MNRLRTWGHLANTLTIVRLILFPLPLIMLIIDSQSITMRVATAIAFAVIIFTDWLDGYFARKWDQVSRLGMLLDPLADKLLVSATMLGLCFTDVFPAPWGWIYLGFTVLREAGVALWQTVRTPGVIIPATIWGKVKTFALGAALVLMLAVPSSLFSASGLIIWWSVISTILAISLVGSIVSGYQYMRAQA